MFGVYSSAAKKQASIKKIIKVVLLSCTTSTPLGKIRSVKNLLPIFTLAPSFAIGLLVGDMVVESRQAKLFGFSLCELDGHTVIFKSLKSSSVVEGDLIWIEPSFAVNLLETVDSFEKPECVRKKALAHCPSMEAEVECWVYVSTAPGFPISPWEGESKVGLGEFWIA